MRSIWLCTIVILMSFSKEKTYTTMYYSSGKTKAEGWEMNGKMVDYWKFFHQNGNLSSEGHFNKGSKEGYWFYYDKQGHKAKEGHYLNNKPIDWWVYYYENSYENCIFQPDGKTRFCLTYENGSISKAKKYVNDVFLQQWLSIQSFKRDNPDFKF